MTFHLKQTNYQKNLAQKRQVPFQSVLNPKEDVGENINTQFGLFKVNILSDFLLF